MLENSARLDTSDRDIVTTRLLDAPCELVFEAWTRPEHLARWWGPRGFTTTTHAFDFRPGGVWRMTMHGPDGTDHASHIVFDEIARPERIVYSHYFGHSGGPRQFQSTIVFLADGGKTRLTMRQVFASAAARDAVAQKYGAVEGARQTLERLAEHLGAHDPKTKAELRISRTFDAPRHLVFAAWTKAEHVSRWFTPRPLTTSQCEVDFRPGGVFRVVMRMPDGVEHPFDGKFGEIVVPERIVFRGKIHGDNETETTVTFTETDGKTTIAVHQTYSYQSDATRGAHQGWTMTLDQLARYLA